MDEFIGTAEPTPSSGHPSQEGMADRETLLQMMALALEVACSSVAHAMLEGAGTREDIGELQDKTYCYILAHLPVVFAATQPQDRIDLLSTTLQQIELERQRYRLERLAKGGQADA
ncbi:MAG: hypothetical protein ACFB0C_15525 [Leptolyngbyaceae cyanobacterium]